ncbi:phage N-6-adenine-methyltransferase [Bacillus subtilis]|uniref:phage N-6-adenine-methyltransferase n=1 Tax=Bacillus subtilis TaxID=1423 RepID=UPI001B977237|nr:phage N-6-adenine-methyltransferase [Bacillus subtilis]CAI6292677.1 Prophage L54a N-6-adenine-methyltransferase [Bacillus subtilis]
MGINQGMMSSNTDLWGTPQDFFDKLNEEFGFELDVCAIPENAKCKNFFTPELDGLKQDWNESSVFMNPPYGNPEHPCKKNCKKKKCIERGYHIDHYIPGIVDWMQKAYEESQKWGNTIVCLVPARTDSGWWHKYAMKGEIRLVEGRLKFNDGKRTAPFPSAVIIFGKKAKLNTLIAI